MSMTGKIGRLLTAIDNAIELAFEDNACATVITPSSTYEKDGVLLNIVIEVLKYKYDKDEYELRLQIFDDCIYNRGLFSNYVLSKVNIEVVEHERL